MPISPKVYAVDIDRTLTLESCWSIEESNNAVPNKEAIEKINKLYLNNFIIIYTARRHELYYSTIKWLEKNGVRYHAVRFEKMPSDLTVDFDSINNVNDL